MRKFTKYPSNSIFATNLLGCADQLINQLGQIDWYSLPLISVDNSLSYFTVELPATAELIDCVAYWLSGTDAAPYNQIFDILSTYPTIPISVYIENDGYECRVSAVCIEIDLPTNLKNYAMEATDIIDIIPQNLCNKILNAYHAAVN